MCQFQLSGAQNQSSKSSLVQVPSDDIPSSINSYNFDLSTEEIDIFDPLSFAPEFAKDTSMMT